MNYTQYENQANRNVFGIGAVIVIHIVIIYALVSGLGRKMVEVMKKPLAVSIIEEVKPPPPPPRPAPAHIRSAPPPTSAPPPPAYVPPPEVMVHVAPVENTVTAIAQTPPPSVVAAAPAPVVEAPKPKVADAAVACPGYKEALGRLKSQADKQSWSGDILVELSVEPSGEVGNVQVLRSSNRMFNSAVVAAVAKIQCAAQGQAVKVDIPLIFRPE